MDDAALQRGCPVAQEPRWSSLGQAQAISESWAVPTRSPCAALIQSAGLGAGGGGVSSGFCLSEKVYVPSLLKGNFTGF